MWLIKYNFSTSVLILGAIAFSSLGNCSPVFDDAGVSSQKSYKDDFIVDSIIPNDFSSGEARIFGNFSFGNSSILTVAGFVIVGIILFELALYALDVYYNQTYVSGAASFDKADTNTGDNIYDNLYPPNAQSNNIYGDYPPYYDYFQGTYRKFSSKWKNLDKILDWIQVAHETYSAGTTVINDIDCQMKVICEIYRDTDNKDLGEIGRRAKHSLDFVDALQYLNLPDEFLTLADEYMVAKESAKDPLFDCEEMYPTCDHSITKIKKKYDNLLK